MTLVPCKTHFSFKLQPMTQPLAEITSSLLHIILSFSQVHPEGQNSSGAFPSPISIVPLCSIVLSSLPGHVIVSPLHMQPIGHSGDIGSAGSTGPTLT